MLSIFPWSKNVDLNEIIPCKHFRKETYLIFIKCRNDKKVMQIFTVFLRKEQNVISGYIFICITLYDIVFNQMLLSVSLEAIFLFPTASHLNNLKKNHFQQYSSDFICFFFLYLFVTN